MQKIQVVKRIKFTKKESRVWYFRMTFVQDLWEVKMHTGFNSN